MKLLLYLSILSFMILVSCGPKSTMREHTVNSKDAIYIVKDGDQKFQVALGSDWINTGHSGSSQKYNQVYTDSPSFESKEFKFTIDVIVDSSSGPFPDLKSGWTYMKNKRYSALNGFSGYYGVDKYQLPDPHGRISVTGIWVRGNKWIVINLLTDPQNEKRALDLINDLFSRTRILE